MVHCLRRKGTEATSLTRKEKMMAEVKSTRMPTATPLIKEWRIMMLMRQAIKGMVKLLRLNTPETTALW
jgi:hypothetical protein